MGCVFDAVSVLTRKVPLELVGVLSDIVEPPGPLTKLPRKTGIVGEPAR
jgi:hypothetical protein